MKKKKNFLLLILTVIGVSFVSASCNDKDEDIYHPSEYANKIKLVKSCIGMSEAQINEKFINSMNLTSDVFYEDSNEKHIFFFNVNDSNASSGYFIAINKTDERVVSSVYLKQFVSTDFLDNYEIASKDFYYYVPVYSSFEGAIHLNNNTEFNYTDRNQYFKDCRAKKNSITDLTESYTKNNLHLGLIATGGTLSMGFNIELNSKTTEKSIIEYFNKRKGLLE